jgi:predicted RNase H-like nuclease (RuvC/YqgF family)
MCVESLKSHLARWDELWMRVQSDLQDAHQQVERLTGERDEAREANELNRRAVANLRSRLLAVEGERDRWREWAITVEKERDGERTRSLEFLDQRNEMRRRLDSAECERDEARENVYRIQKLETYLDGVESRAARLEAALREIAKSEEMDAVGAVARARIARVALVEETI